MIGKLLKIEPDLKDGHIHEAFHWRSLWKIDGKVLHFVITILPIRVNLIWKDWSSLSKLQAQKYV